MDCGDGRILELVGDSGTKIFLVFNVLTGEKTVTDKFNFNGQDFLPPKDELIENGTVLLPSYPEDFGDITDLITFIEQYIYQYLDISDLFRKLASYYILLTWIYECFEVLPYLRTLGDYGTGKTRFQKVVGSICYRPMFAGGATTPSPIFRIIDIYRGTLVLDEADFRFSDADAEIIKIFNCGYSKNIPILRTEGERERIPTSYNVYGPKIIATRKRFKDVALESRCLTEIMSVNSRTDIPIHLPKSFDKEALKIRNMLFNFRLQNYGQIQVDISEVIPRIEPRINQIILPILSIIKDPRTKQEIKDFVVGYAEQLKTERGDELPAQILREMIAMVKDGELLRYKEVAKRINEGKDKEQGEYIISPAKIGKINHSVLNFKTRQVNGITEILWDKDKAQGLCDRYGIKPDNTNSPQVDDVDIVDHPEGDIEKTQIQNTEAKQDSITVEQLSTSSTKSTKEGGEKNDNKETLGRNSGLEH